MSKPVQRGIPIKAPSTEDHADTVALNDDLTAGSSHCYGFDDDIEAGAELRVVSLSSSTTFAVPAYRCEDDTNGC
jgi:hypothetical protein